MKKDPFSGVYRALTPKELAEMLMNRNVPKTEAEHWAVREMEKLRVERDEARAEVERLRKEMLEVAEELENEEPRSHKNIAFGIRNALEAKP